MMRVAGCASEEAFSVLDKFCLVGVLCWFRECISICVGRAIGSNFAEVNIPPFIHISHFPPQGPFPIGIYRVA